MLIDTLLLLRYERVIKTKFPYLFVAILGSLLLAGCCAQQHGTQWEYKYAFPKFVVGTVTPSQTIENFLNEFAKDGWVFVQKDSDGGCVFKRAKR